MCLCTYVSMYLCIHTSMYLSIYMYMYLFVCVCLYLSRVRARSCSLAFPLFHPLSRALSLAFKLPRVSQALLGLDTESITSAVHLRRSFLPASRSLVSFLSACTLRFQLSQYASEIAYRSNSVHSVWSSKVKVMSSSIVHPPANLRCECPPRRQPPSLAVRIIP